MKSSQLKQLVKTIIREVWDIPQEKSYKDLGGWARDNIEQDGTYKGEPLHNYGFFYKVGDKIPLKKYNLINAMTLWNTAKKKRNTNLSLGKPVGVSEMQNLTKQDGVMGAVNVEMTEPSGRYKDDMENGQAIKRLHNLNEYSEIGNGFFEISSKDARKLSAGRLPEPGKEVLVPAPQGMETTNGFVWLARTVKGGKVVWSIRDSGGWKLVNGQARLEEESGTGAVAGYATPYAFSKKKSGSQRALDVTTKMGYKKVGEAPRV